jgi:hypothetical protein
MLPDSILVSDINVGDWREEMEGRGAGRKKQSRD